jgi:DUF2917 family protein
MSKIAPLNRHTRRQLLSRRQILVLADAPGTVVVVDRGCVWITLERDPRDIVLVQGMRFEIDRPGRTIVAAEAPSTLRLLVPETRRERIVASLRRAVARWRNGAAARLARRAVPYF